MLKIEKVAFISSKLLLDHFKAPLIKNSIPEGEEKKVVSTRRIEVNARIK